MASGSEKTTNQTTDRALVLLNLFENNEELGISDIARLLDLKKATAARLVSSLEKYNFLHQNPENKKYRLGMRLLLLGNLAQSRYAIADEMFPEMQRLAMKHRASSTMMVMEGLNMHIIQKYDAGLIINISACKGALLPAYATASGKLVLAYSSADIRENYFKFAQITPLTEYTHTDKQALEAEFARIRECGYSLDIDESVVGLQCISVPLCTSKGQIIATMSLNFQSSLPEEKKQLMLQDLLGAAREFKRTH